MTQKDTPNAADPSEEEVLGTESTRATIVDPTLEEPEPTPGEDTQNDMDSEERLYAGRYKSVEDLETGYKELQAEYTRRQQAEPTVLPQPTENLDPDIKRQLDPYVQDIRQELDETRVEMAWAQMEAEYGKGIRQEVADYFNTLPERDQADLNTLAGARLIAKTIKNGKTQSSVGTQPAGAPKSHQAKRTNLTRAKIDAMSPDEYARRQREVQAFYRENYS